MLRISALEGQLDRYRHGIDEDIVIALERAEAELRRLQEKEKEELEAKDMEVGAFNAYLCLVFISFVLTKYP